MPATSSAPTNYYALAGCWPDASDAERAPFKEFVQELVGYECKLACIANDGWVDVYVLSVESGEVSDWLEVQPSGAIGVVFASYPNPEGYGVMRLSDKCDDYNDSMSVVFLDDVSDSDSNYDSE
jgi:hypothetical protein